MSLRMFSVIGEALHFGARRMGVIARVAWLPVLLLLVLDLATVFAYLSVIAERTITFTEVTTYYEAQQLLTRYAERGWSTAPAKMAGITIGSMALQVLLVASFQVPLIRYAGLGERPRNGLIRLAFGPDQIRFLGAAAASFLFILVVVTGPVAATSLFVSQSIVDAMSQTMASFPEPDSLHTIKIVSAGEQLIADGTAWTMDLALPLIAAAPFALLIWLVGFIHFHPENRPFAKSGHNFVLRAALVLAIVGGIGAAIYWVMRGLALQSIVAAGGDPSTGLTGTPVNSALIFSIIAIFLIGYVNLRLFPYPGVAVCEKSMALGPTLSATRGWNLLRLPLIIAIIMAFLLVVSVVINTVALPMVLSTLSTLFQATETSTRLVNSGAKAEWVAPFFVWVWNFTKIGVNFLWTFFSYGVIAGLYGRLYRDSREAG